MLEQFARVLGENLREYYVLARCGGEEFVVTLPETNVEDAQVVAEKLRSSVEKAQFKEGKDVYKVKSSFGISALTSENDRELDKNELIQQADEALCDAKKAGRNQVMVYGNKKGWFKRK